MPAKAAKLAKKVECECLTDFFLILHILKMNPAIAFGTRWLTTCRKILGNSWNYRIFFQGPCNVLLSSGIQAESKIICLYLQSLFSVVLKEGVPKEEGLEGLGMSIGDEWTQLGRRLKIEELIFQVLCRNFDSHQERVCRMLIHWKRQQGSAATYKSLSHALKHKLVKRNDLAEKYCYKQQ